jgi:hypothetical protein
MCTAGLFYAENNAFHLDSAIYFSDIEIELKYALLKHSQRRL